MIKRGTDFLKPQSHKKRNIFWFIEKGKKQFIEVKELLKGIFMGFVFSCVFLLGFYALAAYPTTAYSPGDTLNPSCAAGSANCTVISPIPYTGATSNVDLGSKTITTTGAGSLGSLTLTTTALTPAYGGTGLSSLTTYAVLTGGTTSTGNLQQVSGLGTSGQVLTSNGAGALPSWQAATGGANTALSNLSSVAINAALVADTAGGYDFGSATIPWADIYFAGTSITPGTNNFKFTGASTSGTRTITFPDASGTATLLGNTSTGSGSVVLATSPTLTTPTIGAATATSINGLTISSSTGTLTITNSKTLSFSNTLTFTGTDASSVAFGAGGTVIYTSNKLSAFADTTSSELAGVISDETGSGSLVFATAPTIAGGSITGLTGLAIRDTSAAYDVTIAATSSTALTVGRTLTLDLVNAARTVKLSGNLTLAGDFITSGSNSLTLTTTGATDVTLPTSGTLVNSAVTTLSSLASVGTITTGVWNGTALTPAYGGTGLSSLTTYAVLTGGTTSTGNLQQVSGLGTSGQVLTSNGAGALPSWQAATGGTAPSVIQGRLTLTTAVPVTTSDVTAATTVYFTPYNGDKIALYDGSTWAISAFTEKSINTTDSQSCTTTSSSTTIVVSDSSQFIPGEQVTGTNVAASSTISSITDATHIVVNNAATGSGTQTCTFKLPASTVYDIFYVQGSGKLQFSNSWSSDTARADAISLQNGLYVNTSAINSADSNTIAAKTGTYIGTIRTTGTVGQTEDSVKSRYVWNNYNRVKRHLIAFDTTATWTYTTATWRAANNSTTLATARVDMVIGQNIEEINASYTVSAKNSASDVIFPGVGLDSTSANSAIITGGVTMNATYGIAQFTSYYSGYPGLGYHYIQSLEYSGATGTSTWYGNYGSTLGQTGLLLSAWN